MNGYDDPGAMDATSPISLSDTSDTNSYGSISPMDSDAWITSNRVPKLTVIGWDVWGVSFGGTMTTYISALDQRVKAAVIVCYLSTLTDALNDRGRGNTCGSQFMFGLRKAGDIAEVAGLIAPRACMAQIGSDDMCFIEADALTSFKQLEKIYAASGQADRLVLDHFQGEHEINLETGIAFLEERL